MVLYSLPPTHIDDITVVTERDGTNGIVRVRVTLNGPAETGRLTLSGGGQTVDADLTFADGGRRPTSLSPPRACGRLKTHFSTI